MHAPRHLGASSPSGNVRGECRGWSPFDHDADDRMNEVHYRVLYFAFTPPFLHPHYIRADFFFGMGGGVKAS
jgi:hypothetical protein